MVLQSDWHESTTWMTKSKQFSNYQVFPINTRTVFTISSLSLWWRGLKRGWWCCNSVIVIQLTGVVLYCWEKSEVEQLLTLVSPYQLSYQPGSAPGSARLRERESLGQARPGYYWDWLVTTLSFFLRTNRPDNTNNTAVLSTARDRPLVSGHFWLEILSCISEAMLSSVFYL